VQKRKIQPKLTTQKQNNAAPAACILWSMRMNQRAMRSWHSTHTLDRGSTDCCSVKSFATMRYLRARK